ncbi:hypothetical protein J6590_056534 [Homalodisca vitripennis]|nr:hypothetical protein J6590_069343 [Homalodisca vitripennis]KAG8330708.1 hypothetical protein J6590_056534 [Homalodisca vitripennis]
MSAKRLRDDDEDLNNFVHRILEEPLSTDRMHGSDESQDEDDFEDNVSAVSSELFGGYDSDMDPEYLPSGNSNQDQLNQPVQLPNILQESENAIPQANQNIQTNEVGLIWENTNKDHLLSFQFNAPPLLSQEIRDTVESASLFDVYNKVFVEDSLFNKITEQTNLYAQLSIESAKPSEKPKRFSFFQSFKVKVTHGGETPCSFPKHSTKCSAVIVFVSHVSVFA